MKLLIADRMRFTEQEFDKLREMGFELMVMNRESEAAKPEYTQAEAVVCYRFFNYNDISAYPSLRLIQTTSAGQDHLPWEEIRRRRMRVYNASGVFSVPMAEFALCGVLQIYKHFPGFNRKKREHIWKQDYRLRELYGKNVCILGTGSVGSECAKRFRACGCRITGLCRHPVPKTDFDRMCPMPQLDEVLPESDIVILSLPLTEETRGLFDAERFSRVKPGAVLVNIARGPVVRQDALLDALDNSLLSGAVLDVFETEPLPQDSPLWDRDDVILTPHNSFVGEGNSARMFALLLKNFTEFLRETGESTFSAEKMEQAGKTGVQKSIVAAQSGAADAQNDAAGAQIGKADAQNDAAKTQTVKVSAPNAKSEVTDP